MLRLGLAATLLALFSFALIVGLSPGIQDSLLTRMVSARLEAGHDLPVAQDTLSVFVCGSSSPVTVPGRAKACIGILANDQLYLFDVGPGSWKNIELWRLPSTRLAAVFLTHMHSDHIGDLAEANTQSWIWGRNQPLRVYGPEGVHALVDGLNAAYGPDARIRFDQAGESLLPRAAATMVAQAVAASPDRVLVYSEGPLRIEAFAVDHRLSLPALGYRIQYGDRVVIISGDTAYSENLVRHTQGADLLLHEAVSERMLSVFVGAVNRSDDERMKAFAPRFGEAHTTTREIVDIAERSEASLVVLYHLLPPPNGAIAERIFASGLPAHFVIAADGMYFTLRQGDDVIGRGSL